HTSKTLFTFPTLSLSLSQNPTKPKQIKFDHHQSTFFNAMQQHQREAMMQQTLLLQQQQQQQQQQQMYHHPVIAAAAMSQIEPVPSGNLPPGFDPSSCRSVYVGNIHVNVSETLLAEVFQSTGPLEGCKLIRKDKASCGTRDKDTMVTMICLRLLEPLTGKWIHVVKRILFSFVYQVCEGQPMACWASLWGWVLRSEDRLPWGVVAYMIKRKEKLDYKSSFGFIDYHDRRSAALAIMTLHGRQLYGQAIKVNWAYASGQREDTTAHFNIFVGDLSPEVTDATLYACFSVYPSCSDARVMWDHKTGRSRGFGFVSFRNQQDAQSAINDLTGKWLGNRQIRCNWASKGAAGNEDKQGSDSQNAVILTNGTADGAQDNTNMEAPENNPTYTTVYVGNLAHEVTQVELHRQFHSLGAGVIEEVRIQRDKGFGFVRYHTHEEAALAIQLANGRIVCGKSMKCSWGSKPTPAGTASNPLPPPVPSYQILAGPGMNQGYSAAELLAYQRQLSLNQVAGSGLSGQSLLQMVGQQGLASAQASAGLTSGGSQNMYSAYPNSTSNQQLMYY
ncbi:hypothetical protein IFM89_023858, partial [Coptis chinensis]